MKSISIHTGKPYDIHIGGGIADSLGKKLRGLSSGNLLAIISDYTVDAICGDRVEGLLKNAGFRVLRYAFPCGEAHKTMDTAQSILSFLAENEVTRADVLVALGGGIVGDITGFCAAVYQRGIDFIQLPTTLLAAVDSSVGGKTGVNLTAGKNLAGAFWQPRLVLCDTEFLNTLPPDILADGMAEVIKYGVLEDPDILGAITAPQWEMEAVITKCVEIKAKYVEADERDTGLRKKLNLGHTFGHAIERASQYAFSHGRAVSIGMMMAVKAAAFLGVLKEPCLPALTAALMANGLPLETELTAETLLSGIAKDKKRENDKITLVLPVKIGECVLKEVPMSEMPSIVSAALKKE